MKLRTTLVVGMATLLVLGCEAMKKKQEGAAETPVEKPPTPVEAVLVEKGALDRRITASGPWR